MKAKEYQHLIIPEPLKIIMEVQIIGGRVLPVPSLATISTVSTLSAVGATAVLAKSMGWPQLSELDNC